MPPSPQAQRWHVGSEPFGRTWQAGDVVGCMIDLAESHITFTLNGEVLISDAGSEVAFKDFEVGEGERRLITAPPPLHPHVMIPIYRDLPQYIVISPPCIAMPPVYRDLPQYITTPLVYCDSLHIYHNSPRIYCDLPPYITTPYPYIAMSPHIS